jgi:DNA-directed RNA polymerase subunit H
MVDVSEHELVPEHSVLDEDVLEDVLQEYNIDRTDLPKIKYNMEKVVKLKERSKDPMKRVRGYGDVDTALFAIDYYTDTDVEPGDVIKIVRDSRTTDQAVVYRLVVE